jgi:hypothetical protein
LSGRRTQGGFAAIHALLGIAFLEVAINRVAVPMLRPAKGVPPAWHTVLDYGGLFLFYFTGCLAAFVVGAHAVRQVLAAGRVQDRLAAVALGIAAGLAAIPLVIAAPAALSFPLEMAFAVAVVMLVVSGFGRERDVGVQIGLFGLAIPLLVHTLSVVGDRFLWPETSFDGPGVSVVRAGVVALSAVALFSPYVFAPRPFARAVTKPGPVVFAMLVAAAGAVIARTYYLSVAKAASLAIGIELNQTQADPRLALYLLSIATLMWTLASCAFAASPGRRQIGIGIVFVVLGGYGFRWPNHYLLPLLGLALIAEAARRVREEELAEMPLALATPAIADAAWSAYIANVKTGLGKTLDDVHTLTSRGDGGLATSVVVGEARGMQVRTRIERIDGSVVALDVILGRECEEVRGATVTLWAIQPRTMGGNPPAPPAAPMFKSNDAPFDERFRTRGNRHVFDKLLDDGLRARAVATLDGWLAYWEPEGLRYRIYPGRGAPLDHPMPLSDLALGRGASADRLVAVVELLVEIAARGVKIEPPAKPTTLDESELAP